MTRLPITLSPVAMNYHVTNSSGYTSHISSMSHVTRDMIISDEGAI